MCVVSAPLIVFGIDRQGKIDAVHTIVLVDDQGRVEKEDGCTILRHYFTLCMYEEASPGWQNTACMLVLVAVRGQHRHEASRGHRRVAGVMDMAELLESWTWPSCWSC